VNCLLLTTDIAFEIWLVKPNCQRSEGAGLASNVEVECIYRRREDNIEMIDFLHMNYLKSTGSRSSDSTCEISSALNVGRADQDTGKGKSGV
jgi:hypothetical protein